jgi:hypothetical protein
MKEENNFCSLLLTACSQQITEVDNNIKTKSDRGIMILGDVYDVLKLSKF